MHATHRQGRTHGGMLGELRGEFLPAARVLVLQLHAGRAERIARCNVGNTALLELLRNTFRLGTKAFFLPRLSAVAASRDHQRLGP